MIRKERELFMNQRNRCIDSLRLIAAFLIICLHLPYYPMAHWIAPLGAVAVPLFFMISGYYLLREDVFRPQITKHIRKIAVLCIAANLLYFLWKLSLVIYSGQDVSAFLEQKFSLLSILRWIFLNESPFGYQLWYLGAMLYSLILSLLFVSVKSQKIRRAFYWAMPVLLLADLCIGEYSKLLFDTTIYHIWVRNFLFTGFPYFLLGNLIYRYQKRLTAFFRNYMLLTGILVFCGTTLLEVWFLETQGALTARNHFLSTTCLAFIIFLFAVKNPNLGSRTPLPQWGSRYSLPIYIFHPIVIALLEILARKLHITSLYEALSPVFVFLASLIVSMLYRKAFLAVKGIVAARRSKTA